MFRMGIFCVDLMSYDLSIFQFTVFQPSIDFLVRNIWNKTYVLRSTKNKNEQ